MIAGVGIHSGRRCEVRLHRAEGPIRFRRGATEIAARLDRVVRCDRCTVLGEGAERVAMVEHLLAALAARGFWSGVVVESSADELPVLDGSAAPWLEAVDALGAPPEPPPPLRVEAPFRYAAGSGSLRLEPGPPLLEACIDYPHPAIGAQRWAGPPERLEELLAARTFGFLEEAEALRRAGLATGASLENAIVFDGDGPMRPLRFADEPVRHKALDALGDLALLGRPIAGKVSVDRGSHRLHVDAARAWTSTLSRPSPSAP